MEVQKRSSLQRGMLPGYSGI